MQHTTKQHFIPVSYLKFFAYNADTQDKAKYTYVHCHNGNGFTGKNDIRKIFYKNNIYEIDATTRQEDNIFEQMLSNREKQYSVLISSLLDRAKKTEFGDTIIDNFISNNNRLMILEMMGLQITRDPEMIQEFISRILSKKAIYIAKHNIQSNQIKKMVLGMCIGAHNKKKSDKISWLVRFIQLLTLFSPCAIGYTDTDSIITGRHPIHSILQEKYNDHSNNVGRIIYPLTPQLVVCLYPNQKQFWSKHLQLFQLTNAEILEINQRIASQSDKICSKLEFTPERLAQIYQNHDLYKKPDWEIYNSELNVNKNKNRCD